MVYVTKPQIIKRLEKLFFNKKEDMDDRVLHIKNLDNGVIQ